MLQKSSLFSVQIQLCFKYVCVLLRSSYAGSQTNACIHRHEAAILLQVNNQTKSVEQKNTPGLNSSCKCFVCQRRRCIPDVKLTFQHFRWWYWGHSAASTRYKDELFSSTLAETVCCQCEQCQSTKHPPCFCDLIMQ